MKDIKKTKEPEPTATPATEDKVDETQGAGKSTESTSTSERLDDSQEQVDETKAAISPEQGSESKQAESTETATAQGKGEETSASVDAQPSEGTEQQEPASVDLSLVSDSTSLQEIHMFVAEDDGKLLGRPEVYTDVLLLIEEIYPEDQTTDPEKVEFGKNRILEFHRLWNRAHNLTQSTLAKYAIVLGKAVLQQRKIVIRSGGSWEDWMAENFRSINPRTLQRYMLLAMREDCHGYVDLGVERSLLLIRATKDDVKYDNDAIGTFLREFGIDFEADSTTTISEFIEGIDAGIAVRRLAKSRIKVDFEQMRRFIRFGGRVTQQMIVELNAIQEDPSKVSQRIEAAIAAQGKFPTTAVTEKIHFTSMIDKTTRIIGEVMKDTALVQQLNLEEIIKLEGKLAELKQMIPIN